tara:strand:- start:6367 stop:7716 length:1350 start_codon:yes stop_codon:yes gene_type:complete
MSANFSNTDKATISSLSRSDIERTMAGLKPFLKRSMWIGTTNRYVNDVIARLRESEPNSATHKRNLAQYIAASTCLHANDGWSYLGRAFACLIAGDAHRALHLGYYAELRAAMSLLAGNGIGVFNNKHFVVPSPNTTSRLRTGLSTHVVSWLALQHWSELQDSGALFASIVRPFGFALSDWFEPRGGISALAPQAKSWFLQWGMDLQFVTRDRDARNESSYRPDGIPSTWTTPPNDALALMRDIWNLLEPSSASAFEKIDQHMLRLAIEGHFQGITGKPPKPTEPAFVAMVDSLINAINVPPSAAERLREFLLRQEIPEDPLLFNYSATLPGNSYVDAFSVISRAVLLLRMATGAAHDLLLKVGIGSELLEFWWQKVGEARGLWEYGSPPSSLSDLWADIEMSLDDVSAIEETNPELLNSNNQISFGLQGRLNVLSSHERVSLWGLCPA